jgi:large subunit ribosomal protein L33
LLDRLARGYFGAAAAVPAVPEEHRTPTEETDAPRRCLTIWIMAKKKGSVVMRLVSMAGTGFFYTIRKAVRANTEPLQLIKFDPRVNARVLFKEEKIKKK